MPTDIKMVLFEDTPQTRTELLDALAKHLESGGSVLPFEGQQFEESDAEQERIHDDRLVSILGRPPYDGSTLFVADRDLSKIPNFRGMSVTAVIGAAKRLAVPICSYARQPAPDDYKWRARWEEGHVILAAGNDDELARQSVLAARGFADIASQLPGIMQSELGKSPAKILAALLGKPEYSDKIALYGVGDQNRLSDVPAKGRDDTDWIKRIGCFLGYWLWDSILRYPGLLVNEVAAASHLNIAADDFRKPEVRGIFKEALYGGPFADQNRPQWWRGMIDDIVSREKHDDGLALVRSQLGGGISASQCSVDSTKTAGYYCIISEKPVSLENSKGGLSWLPRGADLTRISTRLFEEYGPWIGA